jgi:putative ATP-dependent endonuclease of OLD family
MARLRKIEITNFRGIRHLEWCPSPGINCLIGPGDSGKSSILDAIDLCLGARRNIQFSDADFHRLDVEHEIRIEITLGELDDALKNIDTYGLFVRGFNPADGSLDDEPAADLETVLTLRLSVGNDLEPAWTLVSQRAEAQGLMRNLTWGDRVRLAPTRIGALADYHLGWRRGSVLNRVSEERADASAALAKAARDARAAFGEEAQGQLGETLGIVSATAKELGIPVGENLKAMLDAHSVSFSGGTISLHDENGIPLRSLGIGSTRLLIAGLQRIAANRSSIILIDELEHGLEPHRIMRLLGSLGAKEKTPPLQAFMTTHSPVALRELSGAQLFVTRPDEIAGHQLLQVGVQNEMQSTIRLYPEAFLASQVIVCEGASEVGLVRGLDQHRSAHGAVSIMALGTALVDCGGGEPDRPFARAKAFQTLGYATAVIRDDDQKATDGIPDAYLAADGHIFEWRDGRALESELFLCLSDSAVMALLEFAVTLHTEELVNQHIVSKSKGAESLDGIRGKYLCDEEVSPDTRTVLGVASQIKRNGWFKSVSWMEEAAREIIGPDLEYCEPGFRSIVESIFAWAGDA